MKRVCPSCGQRRGRRACPALGQQICTTCCGTKRLKEIACPPECAYLSSAKAHPAAVVQRQHERDLQFLLRGIRGLDETPYRLVLMLHALALRHAEEAIPPLLDADVAEAMAAIAATLETARKGIIYEHQATAAPAQRLAAEITRALGEMTGQAGAQGAQGARLERDAGVALRCVEGLARGAAAAFPEPDPPGRAWLAFARRLMSEAGGAAVRDEGGAAAPPAGQSPAPDAPRIILP